MLAVTPTPEPTSVTEFTGDSLRGLLAVTHLHGRPEVVDDGPQSFVVEARGAGAFNRVHFHAVDQYQVFVGGTGRVGLSRFLPALVHYVDAFMPYGPIESGPEGYVYVTLRPAGDPGARYMPERRVERAHTDGRHHTVPLPDSAEAGPAVEVVIPVEEDGLGAHRMRAGGAGDVLPPPPRPNPGGAHLLVIAGGVEVAGQRLGRLGDVWVPPGEPWPGLRATVPGTEVLALGFPRRDDGRGAPCPEAIANADQSPRQ